MIINKRIIAVYTTPSIGVFVDVVSRVTWGVTFSGKHSTSEAYIDTMLDTSALKAETFTPLASVTPEMVLAWAEAKEGGQAFLDHIGSYHYENLALKDAQFDLVPATGFVTKSPSQVIAEFTAAIQQRLDDFARTRKYDGILSLASYATDPDPKFAAEGKYGVDARSATWAKSYEIMAAVQAGTRPMPTLEQILSELPALSWPA